MASYFKELIRHGFCSVILLATTQAFGQTSESLFDTLMKANVSYWSNVRTTEFEKSKSATEREEEVLKSRTGTERKSHIERASLQLKRVIAENSGSEGNAEAYYQLALLNEPADKRLAIDYVNESLNILEKHKKYNELFLKTSLLASDLYREQEKYEKAEEVAKIAIAKARLLLPHTHGELVRLQIVAGDAAFQSFRFEDASLHYGAALQDYIKAPKPIKHELEPLASSLYVKNIWSHFRHGNSKVAARFVLDYARMRSTFNDSVDLQIEAEIVRMGGIALKEKNEGKDFLTLSADPLAGDFGKRVVLEALPNYAKDGMIERFEEVATLIEPLFKSSKMFLQLTQIRLQRSVKNDMTSFIFMKNAALHMSKNGDWKRTTLLNKEEESLRSDIVARCALEAADYEFDKSLLSKNKSTFLLSAQLFQIRQMEYRKGDDRSKLYLKTANAAFEGGDMPLAWTEANTGLRASTQRETNRLAYFLLVKIARSLSDENADDEALQVQYENTVDAFVAAFPREQNAREALLESAKRAERLGQIGKAKLRAERLLAILPKNDFHSKDENSSILSALASIYAKDVRDTRKTSNEASDLEQLALTTNSTEKSLREVSAVNAGALRAYVHSLRDEGKLEKANQVFIDWAIQHPQNEESPSMLIEAMRYGSQLALWQQVDLATEELFRVHKNSDFRFEAYYWKARSAEENLSFAHAVDNYLFSSITDDTTLSTSERIDALKRSLLLSSELKLPQKQLLALQKISLLMRDNKQIEQADELDFIAAQLFFEGGSYSEAQVIYSKLAKNRKSSPLQETAVVGAALSRLKQEKADSKPMEILNSVVKRYTNKNKSIISPRSQMNLTLALNALNEVTLDQVSQVEVLSDKDFQSYVTLAKARALATESIDPKRAAHIRNQIGKINSLTAQKYALRNTDAAMIAAEKLQLESKRQYFMALQGGDESAGQFLSKSFKRESFDSPGVISPRHEPSQQVRNALLAATLGGTFK